MRLAFERPHVQEGTQRSSATRQHGVNGNRANAQIAVGGSAQRAARVESEPAEGQDEAANQYGRNIVAKDRVARSIAVVLTNARANDQTYGQCRYSSDRVHDARSGEIAIAFA